jgi:type IV pilus assembly protein PilX
MLVRSFLMLRSGGTAAQRGSVLIFTLIALVAMTLATLALVKSVDSTTLISGNLAFRQAATNSGDVGLEAAVAAMATIQTANIAKNPYLDPTHAFNLTNAAVGYYSNADPNLSLSAAATWTGGASSAAADGKGNSYQYIIQRMCRYPNTVITTDHCLFSGIPEANGEMGETRPCDGPGCPSAGQLPQYRMTVRVSGPRNTVSYIQAIVY